MRWVAIALATGMMARPAVAEPAQTGPGSTVTALTPPSCVEQRASDIVFGATKTAAGTALIVSGVLAIIGAAGLASANGDDKDRELKPAGYMAAGGLVVSLIGLGIQTGGQSALRDAAARTCP